MIISKCICVLFMEQIQIHIDWSIGTIFKTVLILNKIKLPTCDGYPQRPNQCESIPTDTAGQIEASI